MSSATIHKLSMLTAVSALAVAGFSIPQISSASAQSPSDLRLDEIIVVAQKREQSILDVPAAVSALSSETLENAGVNDFTGITQLAPSLTLNEGTNTNNSSLFLRGIGTVAFSIGVEPSVSVIVDDVPVVQQAQAFTNLSDIERVEVLRGPQGTLFGKNASAGVVNIVTKGPTEEVTGEIGVTYTDDEEMRLNAGISGPLGGGSAGYRISGYIADRDGHIQNLADNSYLDNDEGWGLRGKFEIDLADNLDAAVILDFSERESNGLTQTYLTFPAGTRLFGQVPAAAFAAGLTAGENNYAVRFDDTPLSKNEQFTGSFKLTYDLGEHSLVSITSYQNWEYEFGQDVDASDFGGLRIFQGGPFESEQWTQEFRLISEASDGFEYLLGLWYSDATTDRDFSRNSPLAFLRANWNSESSTSNYAVFGQGSMSLSDRMELTVGARFGEEEIEVQFNDVTASSQFNGDDSDSFVTGKVALEYEVSDDLNSFFSVSTGYKGQGYDVSSGFTQARADNPIANENSVSYEVGLRGNIMDGRGRFSLVVFNTDYEDYQAQSAVIDPATNLLQLQLNNVGELRTQGIEADFAALLTESLQLDASVALIDATIESFPGGECYPGQTVAQGCVEIPTGEGDRTIRVQDLAGKDLANSPDMKFNLGLTYETTFSETLDLVANVNYQYQDDLNFSLNANPRTVSDGYGIVNASIGLKSNDGKYGATLFVNNLADETYTSNITDLSSLYGGSPVLFQIKPRNSQRYVGVRLSAGF